jgi:four helix bundle protein
MLHAVKLPFIRFYRMAKRSATECAAIFDLCRELQLIEEKYYTQGRELLLRIVAMLVRMAQGSYPIQPGTHAGTRAGSN